MYLAQKSDALGNERAPKEPEVDFAKANHHVDRNANHDASQDANQNVSHNADHEEFPPNDKERPFNLLPHDFVMLDLEAEPTKHPPKPKSRWPRLVRPDLQKWHSLPAGVKHVIIVCGLGATVQGIDQAVVNGAQGLYLSAFNVPLAGSKGYTWTAGLINAAPYLCCVVTCWLTPWLNSFLGRRGTIFWCAMFSIFFAFAQFFAQSWEELLAFRLLMGIGIGPKSATIPVYAAEIAPSNIRGSLVTCWQACNALGIALGCIFSIIFHQWGEYKEASCYGGSNGASQDYLTYRCSWNWRVILASAMLVPIILACVVYFCRESPRWTISKAHRLYRSNQPERAKHYYGKAFRDLQVLSRSRLLAAKHMFIHFHYLRTEYRETQHDRDDPRQTWIGFKFKQLFATQRNMRAITASAICMIAQQLW